MVESYRVLADAFRDVFKGDDMQEELVGKNSCNSKMALDDAIKRLNEAVKAKDDIETTDPAIVKLNNS